MPRSSFYGFTGHETATQVLSDSVIYHGTPVFWTNGTKVRLYTGGWRTRTTQRRMNQAAAHWKLGFGVYQKDYTWYVSLPNGETVPFDGRYAEFTI